MIKKTTNVLEFINIAKVFPGVIALENISFFIKKGTIHAIIGENGAGKSTLMSILFGIYQSNKGYIKINNMKMNVQNPNVATKLGIGMVHQHFQLVDIYSNLDNIILGYEPHKMGILRKKNAIKKIKEIQKKFNLEFNLKQKSSKTIVGDQQKVEIMKMLYKKANILIFDEPTAVLTPQEINGLLEKMKMLKKEGKTIIFISHKLKEVKKVADSVTILRKGKLIKTLDVKKSTISQLVKLMVGTKIDEVKNKYKNKIGDKVMSLVNVSKKVQKKQIKNISFDVHEGEIVVIAGVQGNGQNILEKIILGLIKIQHGKMFFKQNKLNNLNKMQNINHKTIKSRKKMGMAIIPGDRHKYGLILDFKINENLILRRLDEKKFSFFGVIKNKAKNNHYKQIEKQFDIRGGKNGKSFARSLSGGNQQKVIIGRELSTPHNFLLVVQPTRGLDIGAINNIHTIILKEKQNNKAILLISYELDEVLSLADRIIVFNKGKIIGEVLSKNANKKEIGLLMAGIVKKEKNAKK